MAYTYANALSKMSACSTSWTFDDPGAGAAIRRREIRFSRDSRLGSLSGSSSPKYGHAPWFAGSSWTQRTSVAFG